jgi:hypothetical protein
MMKLHLYLIVIILVFLVGSCDYYDTRLHIKNNSNHSIAFDYSLDTIMEKKANEIPFYVRDKILPGETGMKIMPGSTHGWSFLIQRSNNKKLNIFIINIDTLTKHNDFEYIITRKLYKRYEFTEEDLNRINWTIEYP